MELWILADQELRLCQEYSAELGRLPTSSARELWILWAGMVPELRSWRGSEAMSFE